MQRRELKGGHFVYRLRHGNEIVKIGETKDIQQRVRQHLNKGMKFSSVEYDVVSTRKEALNLQAQLLSTYVKRRGGLPKYNKILRNPAKN